MTEEKKYEDIVAKNKKAIVGGEYDLAMALATYCYEQEEYEDGVKVFDLVKRPLTDEENICKAVGYFESGQFEEAAEACLKPAQNGNSLAQYYMGTYYDYHPGEHKSAKDAYRWYKTAADNNYAPAMTKVGEMLKLGEGVKQDYDLASKYLIKAAELGDATAQYILGIDYFRDNDETKGIQYMKLAAEGKQPEAMFEVGYHNLEDNFVKGFNMLKEAAEIGSERAAYVCGVEYLNGNHVEKNIDEAMYYFSKYESVRCYVLTAQINMMEGTKYYDPVAAITMLTFAKMLSERAMKDKEHKECYYGLPTGHDTNFEEMAEELMRHVKNALK